jgi:NhaP-type Na+/H+ or K+/H+ antiporter
VLALVLVAVLLPVLARRIRAPYPVFLALGGRVLRSSGRCIAQGASELALALFIAPVHLDAAYDTSLRDIKDNWAPLTGLVAFAVGLTTAATARVVRLLLPDIPVAAAVALGAMVAPPDAAAPTAENPDGSRGREFIERCKLF